MNKFFIMLISLFCLSCSDGGNCFTAAAEKENMSLPANLRLTDTTYKVDGPANVREKPSGKIIASLADKTYVWVMTGREQDGWYPIVYNDVSGYTHKSNLLAVFK